MAIIPRSQPTVTPNATPLRAVDVNADAVGQGMAKLGQGISSAGQDVGHIGLTIQKDREDLDEFQTKMALTKFHGSQEIRQAEYDSSITGDGRDHTANRLTEFDQDRTALVDSLPNNKKMREYATLHTEALRAQYGERSYRAQQDHIDTYKAQEVTNLAYGQFIPQITGDPESARHALSQVDGVLTGTAMPDAKKDAVRKAAADAAVARWVDQSGADAKTQADTIIQNFGGSLPGDGPDASTGATSDKGLEYIRQKENFAPVAVRDYKQYSSGYGTKARPGEHITREEAEKRLRVETGAVDKYIQANVKVPLTQDQHDSLVSFGFNLGTDDIGKLLPDINAAKFDRVAERMKEFNHAGGQVSDGLTQRRAEEAKAFEGKYPNVPDAMAQSPATSEAYFVQGLTRNLPQIEARAKKLRQQIEDQDFVRGAVDGTAAFNPFNDDQRKKVDNAFSKADVAKELFAGNEPAMQRAVEISQRLNYVPESLTQSIFGLVGQPDPTKRATGYRAAAAIIAKQPYAFDAVPSGAKLRADAEDYGAFVDVGLAPQDAVSRIDEMKTPEWKKAEGERKKDIDGQQGILARITDADVTSAFDTSPFGLARNPSLAAYGPEGRVAMADFKALVRENYVRYGDENLAKRVAIGQMAHSAGWGISTVSGRKTLTRFPIEKQYPEVGGSHDYIGDQLKEDIAEATGKKPDEINLSDVVLKPTSDGRTQRAVSNKSEPPPYTVIYRGDNGVPQTMAVPFVPVPSKAEAAMGEKFAAGRTPPRTYLPHQLISPIAQDLLRWFIPNGAH